MTEAQESGAEVERGYAEFALTRRRVARGADGGVKACAEVTDSVTSAHGLTPAVIDAMHAERAEKNTRNVDCWACEAAKSEAVTILLDRLRETQAALARSQSMLIDAEAVFDLAVPDNEQQRALWRVILQRKLTQSDEQPREDGK